MATMVHTRLLRASVLLVLCVGCMSQLRSQAPVQQSVVTPTAEEKRKALEADVERLVQLARQLKAEVDHTRQDELSTKVLRDTDEIDRLARSARSRLH